LEYSFVKHSHGPLGLKMAQKFMGLTISSFLRGFQCTKICTNIDIVGISYEFLKFLL
jgi:hypothetical protein